MSAVNNGGGRRPYRSQVREQGARRTRQAVVAAAAELFVTSGYATTSLADIAAEAGVSRPTVFAAFGSKPAILRQALDQALAGDDEPVPVAERPWFRPVWEATTAGGVLDAYAGVCVLIGGRAAPLFEAVRRAADDAAEAAELWTTLVDNRRAGAAMVADRVLAVGGLTAGMDQNVAVDILWVYNDPALYAALVTDRGWPGDRFRDWLAASMRAALLPGR